MIAWNTNNSEPAIDLYYSNSIPPSLTLAQLFSNVVSSYNLALVPQLGTGVTGSDQYSFWQYGFNSILAIEDFNDFNPYYHGSGDTPALTDPAYFTNFVKASIGTYAHMSDCLIPSGVGNLSGNVTSVSDGAPIVGVTMTADDGQGHIYPDTTDPNGYYTIMLPAGTYTVTASLAGYITQSQSANILAEQVTHLILPYSQSLSWYPVSILPGYLLRLSTVRRSHSQPPLMALIRLTSSGTSVILLQKPVSRLLTLI